MTRQTIIVFGAFVLLLVFATGGYLMLSGAPEAGGESPTGPAVYPTEDKAFPPPAPDERPEKVGSEILRQYHPVGQVGHIVLQGQVRGTAADRKWGFQGNYEVVADTLQRIDWEVLENDGQTIRFRVFVPASHAMLLASQRRYSVHLPDIPLADSLLYSGAVLAHPKIAGAIPAATEIWDWIQVADPDLQRTATYLKLYLERIGLTENEVAQLGMKMQAWAEDIEDITATLVYKDGVGITQRLEIQGAHGLDPDIVDQIDMQLRRVSPVLGAYFLYPLQPPPGGEEVDTSIGSEWDVDAARVAGLFAAALEDDIEGSIRVRRLDDEAGQVVLEIVRANVRFTRPGNRRTTTAELHVEAGTRITLLPAETGGYRIGQGEVEGTGTIYRATTRYWLFEEQFQADPTIRLRITGHDDVSEEYRKRFP